ncbi:hypothetical protein [Streptomyces sp. NPDC058861]|uniref:hypothetical protein n=1 Tax=Streptomyces sp. NPDC058861 TaxID=3346653 RepID=UPI00369FABE3
MDDVKKETPEKASDQPGEWRPDMRAALRPGSLARANAQLISGIARWTTAEKGETANRVVALLIFGFFAAVIFVNNSWLCWVVGVGWVLTVGGVAAQHAPHLEPALDEPEEEEGDEEHEEEEYADDYEEYEDEQETPGEEDEEETDELNEERRKREEDSLLRTRTLMSFVEDEVATAVHNGTKGVRIAVLLTLFQSRGQLQNWDEDRLKSLLKGIGVPVREQMYFKINGKKSNKAGIHVDDLTETLGRRPRLPAHLVPDLTPSAPSNSRLPVGPDTGPHGCCPSGTE